MEEISGLISPDGVRMMARRLRTETGGETPRTDAVAGALEGLKMRARTDLIAEALIADLPTRYADFARVIRAALPGDDISGWIIWPVGEAVTTVALTDGSPAAFDDALALQAELTPRLSSEFGIRRLIAADTPRALEIITTFAAHDDEHVRRLASEGTRHYLPWATRVPGLIASPHATLPILDALYRDDSDYVRRSVANHLNDLARLHPELVIDTAARWLRDPADTTPALVRHALRVLIKKGYQPALELLGFGAATVEVSPVTLDSDSVSVPGTVDLAFTVTNTGETDAALAIDYVVHYVKSSGTTAPKVFKLTTASVPPGETVSVRKRHTLKQMTTRVHYAGRHSVQPQVNGERYDGAEFDVSLA